MVSRRVRLGVRAQLTLIVLLSAILSTAATLFIANNAIQNYALKQAQDQERNNMKIARLVLQTQYGQNISISSDNHLVVDSPTTGRDFNSLNAANQFGKFQLDGDTDYVDEVQQLIGGSAVSVYKCADQRSNLTSCTTVATTFTSPTKGAQAQSTNQRAVNMLLNNDISTNMNLKQAPRTWLGVDSIANQQYFTDYEPLFNPQQELIGVLFVGVPLANVTSFQRSTTIELLLLGVIIMVAGIILALIFASAIITTLQRVARQVSDASERIGGIAAQQAGGAAQQVWAVNAINKALQGFSEAAHDIAQRTDQLALMGNQVIQRRAEIAPAQIDSILAYMTRSVRDISVSSRQQSSQYERMTGAMQAVIEIAEQVASNSQQSTDSSERLDHVVNQLQELVGTRRAAPRAAGREQGYAGMPEMEMGAGVGMNGGEQYEPTVRAVRSPRQGFGEIPPAAMDAGAMAAASARPAAMQGGMRPAMPGTMGGGMNVAGGRGQGMPMGGPATGQAGNMGQMAPMGPAQMEPPMPPLPSMPHMPGNGQGWGQGAQIPMGPGGRMPFENSLYGQSPRRPGAAPSTGNGMAQPQPTAGNSRTRFNGPAGNGDGDPRAHGNRPGEWDGEPQNPWTRGR